MKKNFGIVLATLSVFLLSACASVKVDPGKIRAVHQAALVGFDMFQQGPADFSLKGMLTYEKKGGMDNPGMPVVVPHALEVYKLSTERLEKTTGWTVLSYESLQNNPVFQAVYKDRMSGMRGMAIHGENFEVLQAEKMMDVGAIQRMSDEQRASFARRLGVQALVVLNIRAEPSKKTSVFGLVGGQKFEPKATANILVYAADGKEMLWQEVIEGEPVTSEGKFIGGKKNIEAVNRAVVEASLKAWDALAKAFRGRMGT